MDNMNNFLPQKIRQIQLLLDDKVIGEIGSVTTSFDPNDGIMFTCQSVMSLFNIADLFAKKSLITLSAKVIKEGQEPLVLHLRNCTIQNHSFCHSFGSFVTDWVQLKYREPTEADYESYLESRFVW